MPPARLIRLSSIGRSRRAAVETGKKSPPYPLSRFITVEFHRFYAIKMNRHRGPILGSAEQLPTIRSSSYVVEYDLNGSSRDGTL